MSLADDLVREAEALEGSGDQTAAHEKWQAAARLDETYEVLSGLGRSHMLKGNLEEAEAILRQAITLFPASAKAHYFLGFNSKRQGDLEAAREALERGLEIENWAPARSILGEVYRQLEEPLKARQHFEAALADDPNNSETWYSLGLTFRRIDNEKAAELFRKAIEVDSREGAAHRELGYVLWEMGDLRAAEESLCNALTLNADDVWAHCYLSYVMSLQKRPAEAETECRRAIELMPEEPLFHCNLGDVLARQDKWDEAERAYLRALSTDVSHYLANFRYGQFLAHRGHPGRAITYLERAIASDPASQKAITALDRIRKGMTTREKTGALTNLT